MSNVFNYNTKIKSLTVIIKAQGNILKLETTYLEIVSKTSMKYIDFESRHMQRSSRVPVNPFIKCHAEIIRA